MKKRILIMLLIAIFAFTVYAATNGVFSVPAGTNYSVLKFTFGTMTNAETVTFPLNGTVLRIVVKPTGNDADGTLTVSDISGVNYISLAATTFSAASTTPVNFVVPCVDQNANVYGGVPVAGAEHTMTLTNCAALGATTIYLYIDRK